MTIAIITHTDCMLHQMDPLHAESPRRVEVIQAALEQYHFKQPLLHLEAPLVTREQLLRVHPATYIDWIESIAPEDGIVAIDADSQMCPDTLRAAYLAAGSVPLAVDTVMSGKAQAAFCNVRPPGHHAEAEVAMGFCFFNNVAIGVRHAMAVHGVKRVAIVDFDVHHGNGTQQIFQKDNNVMLCSSFQHPFYPGYEPEMDNPHIINVPLPAGTGGFEYRQKIAEAWFKPLHEFKPELIFFSAGFDAHIHDPLAELKLKEEDYEWITTEIRKIAKLYSGGKLISVLEGGYHLEALMRSVPVHINALIE